MPINKWIKSSPYNMRLDGNGFFISYLSDSVAKFSFLGEFFAGDTKDETALVPTPEDEKYSYYILNGDWREAYEKLVEKGFDACLEFYHQQRLVGAGSSWATDTSRMPEPLKKLAKLAGFSDTDIAKVEGEQE
jgi:hypothetical protein